MLRLMIAVAVLAAGAPASAHDAAYDAIMKIETDMATSQNADQAVKDYDPRITVYDMIGNSMTGREMVRDDYAKLFAGMRDAKLKIVSIAIESDARFGFAYSVQHLTARSAKGGLDTHIVFRQTDCLHKIDGRWLIINQHVSVPFDPATGRAVFNTR